MQESTPEYCVAFALAPEIASVHALDLDSEQVPSVTHSSLARLADSAARVWRCPLKNRPTSSSGELRGRLVPRSGSNVGRRVARMGGDGNHILSSLFCYTNSQL